MTLQDVLKIVERHDCSEGFWKAVRDAVLTRIPKVPYLDEGPFYQCPTCAGYLERPHYVHAKYCRNCGQKLDWSDED